MELIRSTSRGGYFVRSIFTFVLTVLMTVLLWSLAAPAATHAQPPSADWNGDSIIYNGRQYFVAQPAEAGASHGLPEGTTYYLSVEQTSERPITQKAYVIYFAPGNSPPDAETTATFVEYDYSSSGEFSNPTNQTDINIAPRGESGPVSSCSVDGIGWFICPITVFLANAMDNIFALIAGFVEVQPILVNDTNSPLYTAWDVMRNIANLAFILAFLVIIYSQLTSWGVTNYGLKKLLPRLVVAAILVNVSFLLSALAVDISNIFGYALQDILIQIRQDTFSITNQTYSAETNSWAGITGAILSGGAITAGVVGLSGASGGAVFSSALYFIIPLLVGLLLTVLFVLLILAARQAIIIILIVIAPLAFVANLRPNTEKWFERWRDLFMTMLIFFPAFSLVFGGSQLAGGIIIQNAAGQGSFIMMIFGMAVQVAPLVITPLLLKLSGGLLGKIAGLVNDPRKGLMDRTKSWSKDRAEMHRLQSLSRSPGGKNPFRRIAQRMDNGNQNVKRRTELYTLMNENRYKGTAGYQKIHDETHEAETDKKIVEGRLTRDLTRKVRKTPDLLYKEMESRTYENEVNVQKERLNRIAEGMNSGDDLSPTRNLGALAVRNRVATQDLSLSAISVQTGKRTQQKQLFEALLRNQDTIDGQTIREWAGVLDSENGAESALTYAINLKREAENKLVGERTQLIKHFKLDGARRQMLAMGSDVTAFDSDGNSYTFQASDEFTHDAAIDLQLKTGSFDNILDIIASSGSTNSDFRSTISDAIPANGLPNKALFFAGRFIDEVGKGNVAGIDMFDPATGKSGITYWAVQSILGGKIKAEDLANNDARAIEIYIDAARDGVNYIQPHEMGTFLQYRAQLQETARLILDPSTDYDRNSSAATKEALAKLRDANF